MLALLALLMSTAGCAGSPADTSALRVGAIYPQRGSQAGGIDELNGVRVAADLVNASGGVRGRKLELVAEDAPDAAAASHAVDRLADQGVSVMLGTYSSTESVPASARASARGAVYLETGALAGLVTSRGLLGVLRTVVTGDTLGRQAVRFVTDVVLPGMRLAPTTARAVVLFEGDAYGSSVAAGAIEQAGQLGLTVVDTIRYDPARTDFGQLAETVRGDRPDVIVAAPNLADAIAFRRAMVAHRVRVKVMVGSSSAYSGTDFGTTLGADAVGLFAVDKPDPGIRQDSLGGPARDLLRRATAAYQARFGTAMSSSAMAGFVGGWVMFHDVLPRAGSTSRDAVWKAAMAVDLPAGSEINGAGIRFAPASSPDAGQNERAVGVVSEWVAPGRRTIVYPPAFAQEQPRLLPLSG
jgi:branched-chain amino acid transport system substrate-binding protein